MRALVVDDQRTCRMVLAMQLETMGCLSVTIADPEAALEVADTSRFDIGFIDVHMPGTDGIALLKKLTGLSDGRRFPIIMVSVDDDRSVRQAALDAGAEGFLIKPVSRADIAERIEKLRTESVLAS